LGTSNISTKKAPISVFRSRVPIPGGGASV
jgi:hypothetical protein